MPKKYRVRLSDDERHHLQAVLKPLKRETRIPRPSTRHHGKRVEDELEGPSF